MKKIYYIGVAAILVLIVVALALLVKGLQNKKQPAAEGLLPEEVAKDQEQTKEEESKEEVAKELPEPTQGKTATSTKSQAGSQTEKSSTVKSAVPQYEYYMRQTQTVTIEVPAGRDYSKTCSNDKCEVVIY